MTERQKYYLFSKDPLSKENLDEILKSIRGSFLTWAGDINSAERTRPYTGMCKYLLDCSEFTIANRSYLMNKMNLKVEIVREVDLSARLTNFEIKEYHDPAPPPKSPFREMH